MSVIRCFAIRYYKQTVPMNEFIVSQIECKEWQCDGKSLFIIVRIRIVELFAAAPWRTELQMELSAVVEIVTWGTCYRHALRSCLLDSFFHMLNF